MVEADLGDLRLAYRDPEEVVWLMGADRGNLHETCHRVASLAATVARQLADSAAGMNVPTTTFDDRIEHGPWWSANG